MECREDYRYNLEAVEVLIRSHLVNMQQYDMHLAQGMENGLNYMAVAFTMQLVQRFCLDDKHGTHEADFYNTIETLARIAAHSRQAPEGYVHTTVKHFNFAVTLILLCWLMPSLTKMKPL